MDGYQFLTYKQTVDMFKHSGYDVLEIIKEGVCIANVPELGDRVVAASSTGVKGINPFFLIPADIKGEAEKYAFRFACGLRDWTGPEGAGRMSLYHKRLPLTFEDNWYVQEELNVPKLRVTDRKFIYQDGVETVGEMRLVNKITDAKFHVGVEKTTKVLYQQGQVHFFQGMDLHDVSLVGIDRKVKYTNLGNEVWGDENGYLFIWSMAMMGCDDQTKIYIPHKGRTESMVEDFKFNDGKPIPAGMRKKLCGVDVIDADGKERWKVGVGGEGTKGILMSYMPSIETLALLTFSFNPEGDYLDGRWTKHPMPTDGQALCAYNNNETIPILPGRFHELEAISESIGGGKGSSGTLSSRLIFVTGPREKLEMIVQKGTEHPRIRLAA